MLQPTKRSNTDHQGKASPESLVPPDTVAIRKVRPRSTRKNAPAHDVRRLHFRAFDEGHPDRERHMASAIIRSGAQTRTLIVEAKGRTH
jgi:hypothetical protein